MSDIYYPGCKYTAHAPENSKKLQEYLQKRFGMNRTGCCSTNFQSLSAKDTAIYICPTCSAILEESAPQAQLMSVWELLNEDEHYAWPDYHGMTVTIQDCWRTYDHRPMQDAIRSILKRMHVQTVELQASYDKADFCGISLLKPQSPRYERLAPERFIKHAGAMFISHTEEEQIAQMKKHCSQYQTDTVVCYCTGCLEGLQIGGVHGVHLMDLVMGVL